MNLARNYVSGRFQTYLPSKRCEYPGCNDTDFDGTGRVGNRVRGYTSGGGWNSRRGRNDQNLCRKHFEQMFDFATEEEPHPEPPLRPITTLFDPRSYKHFWVLKEEYYTEEQSKHNQERVKGQEPERIKRDISSNAGAIGLLIFILAIVFMGDIFPLLEPFAGSDNNWQRSNERITNAEALYCCFLVPILSIVVGISSMFIQNKMLTGIWNPQRDDFFIEHDDLSAESKVEKAEPNSNIQYDTEDH